MLTNGLIRPGTWIGYDDWGSTARWSAGESQAHLEMARKHGVRFELKWNNCRKVEATNPQRCRREPTWHVPRSRDVDYATTSCFG